MKANQIQKIHEALRDHVMSALMFLYKASSVGTEKLKLGDHEVIYSDGAEYTIQEIDCNMSIPEKPDLVYYQEEDGVIGLSKDHQSVSGLPTDVLIDLLESMEQVVNWHYDGKFKIRYHQ